LDLGREQELDGALLEAASTYADALKQDPENYELLKAAGRLAVALKNFPLAAELLEKAQYRRSNDAEVAYYIGHGWNALGDARKARVAWEQSQIQPQLRPAAQLQLARLAARSGERTEALGWLHRAFASEPSMLRAGGIEVALLRANGDKAARQRLDYWREFDPSNSMLRVEAVKLGAAADAQTLWRHLSADPARVIEVATEYMGLGLYRDAVELLGREYPAISADEAEPGTPRPQDDPLVAYYLGYCRLKLHESAAGDFARASRLSTRYVFPQRPEAMPVLAAALEQNPKDATAHFLNGSLYMSGGMTAKAVDEWESARRMNPRIPVLHRDLGRALLTLNKDERRALEVFQEGLPVDPLNVELYEGVSSALGILRRPPEERIKALEDYPDKKALPTPLVFDTALTLAEAGRFADARAMFRDRYFEREEGGTNVREVYLEVKLLEALAMARRGKAEAAHALAAGLGRPEPGLGFTNDGLEVFLHSPRFEFALGRMEARLGNAGGAQTHWKKAASGGDVYALLALRELKDAAWQTKTEAAVSRSAGTTSDALYRRGVLLRALGRDKGGEECLKDALRQPDRRMAHYLARNALLDRSE
jgi:tetratricopeptide (TPR) repeat protein